MIGEQASRTLGMVAGITALRQEDDSYWAAFWPGVVSRIAVDLDEAGDEAGSRIVADLMASLVETMVQPMTPAEEYEQAGRRVELAAARLIIVQRAGEREFAAAEAEAEAARANLRRFEASPGIPLPQYDPLRQEGTTGAAATPGRPDVARGATPAQVRAWAGREMRRPGASLAETRSWVSAQLELWQQRQEGGQA